MNTKSVILCAIVLNCFVISKSDYSSVVLSQGELIGQVLTNENGKEYYSYTAIPYAKPPVGNLRFKPPQKLESWEGVFNATLPGNICQSFNISVFRNEIRGDEDCLIMNVFVPKISTKPKLPVLFWIHGGGFVSGSGNLEYHGPDYFLDYDVILVTFNYRLGPLGFLNLELEGAPGNVGLLDQVEALKWTKENIAKFGGDPDNITIGGVSAGSASVHYHLLSERTAGLFQKAISHSGSAFHPWAFQKHHIKRAFELCEALGYKANDTEDVLNFLLEVPANKLFAKMPPEVDGELIEDFIFVPTIEKRFTTHKPYLDESPLSRMKSGKFNKVPQIIGFNSGEGIYFNFFLQENPEILNQFEADIERFIPTDLELAHGSEPSKQLGEKIRKFYFNDEPVSGNIQKLVEVISDNWATRGVNEQVKLTVQNQTEPVYYYEYSFSESHPAKSMFGDHNLTGVCHGEELVNLFKLQVMSLEKDNPNALLTQKRMLEMWTNFIKYGNPTPEITDILPIKWEPVTTERLNYLNINTTLTLGVNPESSRIQFWEDVTKNLNNQKTK